MLQAQLKGKLNREQENLEDILTSNVFGCFKYLVPNEGLMPFLRLAAKPGGSTLKDILKPVGDARYDFWSGLKEAGCEGCEPDVIIRLEHQDGSKSIVLIEAKYRSGKSSEAEEEEEKPNDQLAKEWDNLAQLAEAEKARAFLIYVTSDFAYPAWDIEASQEELIKKRGKAGEIYWLSWRHLIGAFPGAKLPILQDLVELMDERYALSFFRGFSFDPGIQCSWQFFREPPSFRWPSEFPRPPWSFTSNTGKTLQWVPEKSKLLSWRFEK